MLVLVYPHVGSTHLIVHDCAFDFLDKADHFPGIFPLVGESRCPVLLQQGIGPLSNPLQGAEREIRGVMGRAWCNLPEEFFTPPRFLRINAIRDGREVID